MPHQFKRNKIIAISVIVLLVLCLFFLLFTGKKGSAPANAGVSGQNGRRGTVIVSGDRRGKPLAGPEPAAQQVPRPERIRTVKRETTTAKTRTAIDTSDTADMSSGESPKAVTDTSTYTFPEMSSKSDTDTGAGAVTAIPGCAGDTTKPWVYPDPSGGLHRKAIMVTFVPTKPCTIEWKADSGAPWVIYKGESIPVKSTTTLFFRAHDPCGNVMEARKESYELKQEDALRYCPQTMEYISIGQHRYCIDKYEWPNKMGVVPRSFVSIYQAMDSCMSAEGKHLCTSDEWTLACTGPNDWRYPYGVAYEPHACVTQDTAVRKSGSKAECRGYFEVYDMSGNLAEWTNTKSGRNPQFYNVKGGFWESGMRSGCFDVRYSYYPQNRHNPVGFRCCKEARP